MLRNLIDLESSNLTYYDRYSLVKRNFPDGELPLSIEEYYLQQDSVILKDFEDIFGVYPTGLKRILVICFLYTKDHISYFRVLNDTEFMNELHAVFQLFVEFRILLKFKLRIARLCVLDHNFFRWILSLKIPTCDIILANVFDYCIKNNIAPPFSFVVDNNEFIPSLIDQADYNSKIVAEWLFANLNCYLTEECAMIMLGTAQLRKCDTQYIKEFVLSRFPNIQCHPLAKDYLM